MKNTFLHLKIVLVIVAVVASTTFSGPIFATKYSSAEEVSADVMAPVGHASSDPAPQVSSDPAPVTPVVSNDPTPVISADPVLTKSITGSDPTPTGSNDPAPTPSADPAPVASNDPAPVPPIAVNDPISASTSPIATNDPLPVISNDPVSTSTDPSNDPASPHSAPIITLLGDNPMTIVVGNDFVDPGATAVDWRGDDISNQISVSTSSVDINNVGVHQVLYTVSDSTGAGATANREINVVADTNPPTGNTGGGGGSSGGGGRRGTLAGQVLGAEIGPGDCQYLNAYLKQGMNNNPTEVLKLQLFLKNIAGFVGLTPNGLFDDATFSAVSAFQSRYAAEVLTPWGYRPTESTGYVYITTSKKINELACNKDIELTPAQQQEIASFRSYITGLRNEGLAVK